MKFFQLYVLSFQEELYNEPVSASYKKCQLDRLTVNVGRDKIVCHQLWRFVQYLRLKYKAMRKPTGYVC